MPQIRTTAKFAKDIKITSLAEPKKDLHFVGDWIVDVVRVNRKKVAMATHFPTRIAFLIPYAEVGGAKNTIMQIPIFWRALLFREGLRVIAEQVEAVFQTQTVFCKTKDRSVLGHMNDFKYQIECMTLMGKSIEYATLELHSTLINYMGRMDSPLDYLHELSKE